MINPYLWAAGLIFLALSCAGSFRIGMKVERSDWQQKELTRAEKVIVRERTIAVEVPKIVTKVVEKRVEVEKEVERVVTVIPKVIAPDCVLPDGFGRLLVLTANGLDPETARGANALDGAYGCREVLEALIRDHEAGGVNASRLQALQEWVELVTKDQPRD